LLGYVANERAEGWKVKGVEVVGGDS